MGEYNYYWDKVFRVSSSSVRPHVAMHTDGPMDTKPEAVARVTFIPSMKTFDEEMAETFGKHLSEPPPLGATATTRTKTL